MGRPPIGKKAMTPKERQRRRRAKLNKERQTDIARKLRLKRRQRMAEAFSVPEPPGLTLWRWVWHEETQLRICIPTTTPLPAVAQQLEDDEVLELLHQLMDIAKHRGLDIQQRPARTYPSHETIAEHEASGGTVGFGAVEGAPNGGMDALLYYVGSRRQNLTSA